VTVPFAIDTRSPTPIYDQIVTRMRFAIASGSLPRGEALPSVRQLAVALRVNPNTVARAYRELEAQGLVQTQQGRGTFVAEAADARKLSAAQRKEALGPAIERVVTEGRMLGVEPDELAELVRQAARKLAKGERG
jgi:GntR family transcriptional regulator